MDDEEKPDVFSELIIAKWRDRFFAWLIDFILISLLLGILFAIVTASQNFVFTETWFYSEGYTYLPTSLVFFAYWIILESKNGQSIGKKVLKIKTTNMNGDVPDFKSILISSFGKAFILPFDVVLGWIFTNQKRQRIFNKFSDTLVIKIETDDEPENISYKKD